MSVAGPEGPGDAHAFPYKNLNIRFCGLGRTAFFCIFSRGHFAVRQSHLGRTTAELWSI